MNEEIRKRMDEMISSIQAYKDQLEELESIARDASPSSAQLKDLDDQIAVLSKAREAIMAVYMEEAKDALRDVAECRKGLERRIETLKNFCHNLPRDVVENGLRYSLDGTQISVSKTKYITTYKTTQLLQDYPELEDAYVDGDPLCTVTIVPEILDRLIAANQVQIDDIDRYRIVSQQRSPSVSITFKEGT